MEIIGDGKNDKNNDIKKERFFALFFISLAHQTYFDLVT